MNNLLKVIIITFLILISVVILDLGLSHPRIKHADCYASKGEWKLFGHTCADSCDLIQKDPLNIPACGDAETYGCDCGPDKCWDGSKCIYNEQKSVYFDQKNYARFELPQEDDECKTDSECFIGGCSGEKCTASEGIETTCEVPEGMIGGLSCKCISERCIWTR